MYIRCISGYYTSGWKPHSGAGLRHATTTHNTYFVNMYVHMRCINERDIYGGNRVEMALTPRPLSNMSRSGGIKIGVSKITFGLYATKAEVSTMKLTNVLALIALVAGLALFVAYSLAILYLVFT